jgi:predicted ATP-binding protein involved in virulence
MSLLITGEKEYKGFLLTESFTHTDSFLVVLTGKNGCGKTRLLESMKSLSSIVKIEGEELTNQEILFLSQNQLIPSFGNGYNDSQYQMKITSTLQLFERIKNDLDSPFKVENTHHQSRMNQDNSLSYESLFYLCNSIAKYLNKPASELTHNEIKLNFEDYVHTILGFQNISTICNQYIHRKKLNKYNRYRALEEKEDIQFFTDDKFLEHFGKEPWLLINEIIDSIFDGKFYFTIPEEKLESYSYNTILIQKDTGTPITVELLSSGEKTLLWLSLTLFNSQYYGQSTIKTPKLLLLDEPDAFLHPKMVEKCIKY